MIKVLFQRVLNTCKKILIVSKHLKKVYKHGGYATANISYIKHGETLKGKRILVSGGSSGIGLSIANKCIQEGALVVITGRNETKLNKVIDKIDNPSLQMIVWDHSDISKIQSNIDKVIELLGGGVDILVNNAAVMDGAGFPNVEEAIWDKIYATNSKGLFFLTQAVTRVWMKSTNHNLKKVINISSQGGFVGSINPYRMTKWDIAGLTQGLGLKLAPLGIIVNGIAPGIVLTDMQGSYKEQQENIFCDKNPVQRFSFPEEIAELAVYLMGDRSNFIVGQTIISDGGYSLK
jgi:3-oxoacyl-[acyl-carrier protein] reductase